MEEAGVGLKGLDGAAAGILEIGGDLLAGVVPQIQMVVDNIHHGIREIVAGLKDDVTVGVTDTVIGDDGAVDKLLHDVLNRGEVGIEALHILLVLELIGGGGAYAVIGLNDDGIADLGDKSKALFHVGDQMIAGSFHAGLGVEFFHAAFILDAVDAVVLEARGDVEVGAQLGIPQQPVFVVGLQPVDLAVFESEEGHSAVDLVIILHAGHLIVFHQRIAALGIQLVIRAVADAQSGNAVALQPLGEMPVGFREIR